MPLTLDDFSSLPSSPGISYPDLVTQIGADTLCTTLKDYVDCSGFMIPVLVSAVVGSVLTGVVVSQAYSYTWIFYCRHMRSYGILSIVWASVVFQLISAGADLARIVDIFGTNFGSYDSFVRPRAADALIFTSNAVSQAITHVFLLLRAYKFSKIQHKFHKKVKRVLIHAVLAFMAFLIVTSFVGCLVTMVEIQVIGNQMLLAFRTKETKMYDIATPIWLASATIVDITLAGIIFWELYLPKKERSHRHSALHDRIISFLLLVGQSGVSLALLQLATLIIWEYYLSLSNPLKWSSWMLLPQTLLGRYYTITLLNIIMIPYSIRKENSTRSNEGGQLSTLSKLNAGLSGILGGGAAGGRGRQGDPETQISSSMPLTPKQAMRFGFKLDAGKFGHHHNHATGHFPHANRAGTGSFVLTSPTKSSHGIGNGVAGHDIVVLRETLRSEDKNSSEVHINSGDPSYEKQDYTPTSGKGSPPFYQSANSYRGKRGDRVGEDAYGYTYKSALTSRMESRRPSSTLIEELPPTSSFLYVGHGDNKGKEEDKEIVKSTEIVEMFPSPPRSRAGSTGIELMKSSSETKQVPVEGDVDVEMQQHQAAYSFFSAAKAEAEAEAGAGKSSPISPFSREGGEQEIDLEAYRFGKDFSNPSTPLPYSQVFQQPVPLSPSHVIGTYTPPREAFGSLPGFSHDNEDNGERRGRGRRGRGRDDSSDVDDALSQDYEQGAKEDRSSSRFSFD